MYYLISLVIMVVVLFVWQIPADRQENMKLNKANDSTSITLEKKETNNQIPETKPAKQTEVAQKFVDQDVPFTSQAPFGGWSDERQQDGCEEASALMAVYWAKDKGLNSFTAWEKITDISDFEQRSYGEYRDITLSDIVDHIFIDYFAYKKISLKNDISIDDIILELNNGNLVLAPMDGQKLGNPYFKAPGPERHMLVIRGYDPGTKEFITNDPGTKRGEAYRYDENVLFEAIRSYPTGYHEPIKIIQKNIIIVSK